MPHAGSQTASDHLQVTAKRTNIPGMNRGGRGRGGGGYRGGRGGPYRGGGGGGGYGGPRGGGYA
jgi:polyadenylate-binding protein 2